jgi:hypothetical protein
MPSQLTPTELGIALLLSRLVAEVGLVRTNSLRELADWLAKLDQAVRADIEQTTIPGASTDIESAIKEGAKGALGFALGRISFNQNA